MSDYEKNYARMEGERIGAWDAYSSARPDVNRDPIYERLFGVGFDRAWGMNTTRIATLESELSEAKEREVRLRAHIQEAADKAEWAERVADSDANARAWAREYQWHLAALEQNNG